MGTLFQAPAYDPQRAKRRRNLILLLIGIVVVIAALLWAFRFWPQQHLVDQFFAALEQKDYEKAYGIYQHDPNWKQHVDQYKSYPFGDFYRDWGPGGDWGLIRSYKINAAGRPPGQRSTSTVQVEVTLNEVKGRTACMWVLDNKQLTTCAYQ